MIIRSIVSSRDVGFLPGTIKEKMAVYEEPYRGIFSELFGRGDAYEVLKNKGIVEFCSTSYLRGTTLNNTFVILDEFQNCNYEEIRTILTRLGKNTRIFLCGDTRQNDLYRSKYDVSGMEEIVSVLETMKEFDIIDFGVEDIVRSDIVKSFIIAEEEYLKNKKT
jgi:phosphate starvation-inducible protein PhoH